MLRKLIASDPVSQAQHAILALAEVDSAAASRNLDAQMLGAIGTTKLAKLATAYPPETVETALKELGVDGKAPVWSGLPEYRTRYGADAARLKGGATPLAPERATGHLAERVPTASHTVSPPAYVHRLIDLDTVPAPAGSLSAQAAVDLVEARKLDPKTVLSALKSACLKADLLADNEGNLGAAREILAEAMDVIAKLHGTNFSAWRDPVLKGVGDRAMKLGVVEAGLKGGGNVEVILEQAEKCVAVGDAFGAFEAYKSAAAEITTPAQRRRIVLGFATLPIRFSDDKALIPEAYRAAIYLAGLWHTMEGNIPDWQRLATPPEPVAEAPQPAHPPADLERPTEKSLKRWGKYAVKVEMAKTNDYAKGHVVHAIGATTLYTTGVMGCAAFVVLNKLEDGVYQERRMIHMQGGQCTDEHLRELFAGLTDDAQIHYYEGTEQAGHASTAVAAFQERAGRLNLLIPPLQIVPRAPQDAWNGSLMARPDGKLGYLAPMGSDAT